MRTPKEIGIVLHGENEHWLWDPRNFPRNFAGIYTEIKIYMRTSHAWAARNLDQVLWLQPICTGCIQNMPETSYCYGSDPFDVCGGLFCNRGSIPYRYRFTLDSESMGGLK